MKNILILISIIWFFSCKKESTPFVQPVTAYIDAQIFHKVGNKPLQFDTMQYTNEANNKYGVTRVQYFLSGFEFRTLEGNWVSARGYKLIDGRNDSNWVHLEINPGHYNLFRFLIGLPPNLNKTHFLGNDPDILNMFWPEVIGGGYHFLKFEGNYYDTANARKGFTMHLGTSEMVVSHIAQPCNLNLNSGLNVQTEMTMDLNEWFENPYTYDFNKDGNYTMAIPTLMTLLKNNGNDVFNPKP